MKRKPIESKKVVETCQTIFVLEIKEKNFNRKTCFLLVKENFSAWGVKKKSDAKTIFDIHKYIDKLDTNIFYRKLNRKTRNKKFKKLKYFFFKFFFRKFSIFLKFLLHKMELQNSKN